MVPSRLALALIVLVVEEPGVSTAHSRPTSIEKARTLFKQAEVHFSLGEFQPALSLYKKAYRTHQLPELLFNIGQCHRHLGQCKEAVFHFRQFLLHQPNAPEKPQVNDLIRECEALAKKPSHHHLSRAWVWASGATAAALLVTATVTGVLARGKFDESNEGQSLEVASWVTLGLGATALGGTVVLYLLGRPPRHAGSTHKATTEPGAGSMVGIAPSPGGGLLQLQGTF